jgi:hypothetical protein
MVSDSGQVADVTEFQDDQGINLDDEEAVGVEKGEFSNPPPALRKSFKPAPAKSSLAQKAAPKRAISASASVVSDQEEGGKKKKAKKA